MDNKHRQELLEQYEEAAMMLLMDEYAEADGARLLYQFEEAEKNGQVPEIPADLDEKCRKLIQDSFAKQERKNRLLQLGKAAGRVAVYVLVLLGLTTSVVLSVDAIRVPVLNFFMEQTERYSTVSFDKTIPTISPEENPLSEQIKAWLSDDYSLVVEEYNNGETFLVYQNRTNQIISFSVANSVGQQVIDTEDATQEEMTLNNYPAILIKKDGYRLIWSDEKTDLVFDLYANGLELDTFIKLAHRISCEQN